MSVIRSGRLIRLDYTHARRETHSVNFDLDLPTRCWPVRRPRRTRCSATSLTPGRRSNEEPGDISALTSSGPDRRRADDRMRGRRSSWRRGRIRDSALRRFGCAQPVARSRLLDEPAQCADQPRDVAGWTCCPNNSSCAASTTLAPSVARTVGRWWCTISGTSPDRARDGKRTAMSPAQGSRLPVLPDHETPRS
jgi:hypothetical protein